MEHDQTFKLNVMDVTGAKGILETIEISQDQMYKIAEQLDGQAQLTSLEIKFNDGGINLAHTSEVVRRTLLKHIYEELNNFVKEQKKMLHDVIERDEVRPAPINPKEERKERRY